MTDLSKKYSQHRVERFWDEEKSSGTCLHPVHNNTPVDSLLTNLERGQKKLVIGSHKVGVMGLDVSSILASDAAFAKIFARSTLATYLAPIASAPHAPSNHNEGWEHLKDALFDLVVQNVGTVKGLKFETFTDLREFIASEFVDANGALLGSVAIEAYFIEDNSLPILSRLRGTNAIWGSLRGGHSNWGSTFVVADALNNDQAFGRTIMETIWTNYWGAPPANTYDELRAAFWLTGTIRHGNIFHPGNGFFQLSPGSQRGMYDTVGTAWANAGGQNGQYRTNSIWKINWDTKNIQQVQRNEPALHKQDRNVSFIRAYQADIDGGNGRAVYLKPFSVDSVFTNWFDPALYDVVLQGDEPSAASVFYTVTEANAYAMNNQNSNTGARLCMADFYMRYLPVKYSSNPCKAIGFRLHKKGTPYVSSLGPNKLVSRNARGARYTPQLVLQ